MTGGCWGRIIGQLRNRENCCQQHR